MNAYALSSKNTSKASLEEICEVISAGGYLYDNFEVGDEEQEMLPDSRWGNQLGPVDPDHDPLPLMP